MALWGERLTRISAEITDVKRAVIVVVVLSFKFLSGCQNEDKRKFHDDHPVLLMVHWRGMTLNIVSSQCSLVNII